MNLPVEPGTFIRYEGSDGRLYSRMRYTDMWWDMRDGVYVPSYAMRQDGWEVVILGEDSAAVAFERFTDAVGALGKTVRNTASDAFWGVMDKVAGKLNAWLLSRGNDDQ